MINVMSLMWDVLASFPGLTWKSFIAYSITFHTPSDKYVSLSNEARRSCMEITQVFHCM